MDPLVSVCIPTYNRSQLLRRAVESACGQTFANVEVIVADNCSTDDTESLVRRMGARDGRIRYIRNEENVGPARNWQVAVDAARGKYCKILFSDDEMTADCLDSCVRVLEEYPDASFVLADSKVGPDMDSGRVCANYCEAEGLSDSDSFIRHQLLEEIDTVSPTCALFRTADLSGGIVTENPYFMACDYLRNGAGPDLLIFLNAAARHRRIAYLKRPLTLYRASADSFTVQAFSAVRTQMHLARCYAKARYQFAREHFSDSDLLWYYQFLCHSNRPRKGVPADEVRVDFALKGRGPARSTDFLIGKVLRLNDAWLAKAKLWRIMSQHCNKGVQM